MQRKGSIISGIFSGYRRALDLSQKRYTDLYTERAANAIAFYEDFLKNLIVGFDNFQEASLRRRIRREVEAFFGRDEIQFVAIDGTCKKDPFTDFMVFSSIAYGVRGEISLQGDPPKIQYKRRGVDEDISFVAYVPVPFAEIEDVANPERLEDFVVTDQEKVDLSSIHNTLMQLAEVYLAYEMARSTSPDRARLILMDHSPSSIMASAEVGTSRDKIGLLGYQVGQRTLNERDAIVVYAHPFNEDLSLPSSKRFRLYNAIIAEVVRKRIRVGQQLDLTDFAKRDAQRKNITIDEWFSEWQVHYQRNTKAINRLGKYDATNETFTPIFDYEYSWRDSIRLFEDICYRLFKDKDQEALIYETPDEDDPTKIRRRWMSPNDVKFLVSIGLRALIEECWKNRVMLLGIVKDSQSRYFTRNYYGVMRHAEVYDAIDVKPLPWTDRIVLEDIAYGVSEITAPWAITEFDSCFMTLHLGKAEGSDEIKPMGVRGDIVNQERLFARSLGQFFLRRRDDKASPLMGHVIFMDRLLHPYWDLELCQGEDAKVVTNDLGTIQPFLHRNNTVDNPGQRIAMYFLDTLTRNLFPEAIGYPDPLHKADGGAKTVGRKVAQIIADSAIFFVANPLSKSMRTIRDSIKR
ncbi:MULTISPECIES: hypothetical protein [Cyanophyceae]|uniref:hypothetical protein n=1 Tax=Cyanophyceae TaxID=3028117 RepID=UPI0016823356|nr:hypothetical protein [Trichocoleus sp. FACHB-69]MBD1932504.1 hypothetical protein [Trichocoleus sp. FACHB-69]